MSFHKLLWLIWTARSTVFCGIFNWLRDSPTFTWTCFSPPKAGFTLMVFWVIFNWLRDSPTFAWTCFSPSIAGFTPMGKANFCSAFDLSSGFHQIQMDLELKKYTAFSTPEGHFEYEHIPFGLKNASATSQRMVDTALQRLTGKICFALFSSAYVRLD